MTSEWEDYDNMAIWMRSTSNSHFKSDNEDFDDMRASGMKQPFVVNVKKNKNTKQTNNPNYIDSIDIRNTCICDNNNNK